MSNELWLLLLMSGPVALVILTVIVWVRREIASIRSRSVLVTDRADADEVLFRNMQRRVSRLESCLAELESKYGELEAGHSRCGLYHHFLEQERAGQPATRIGSVNTLEIDQVPEGEEV